jgi:hypothetical protein
MDQKLSENISLVVLYLIESDIAFLKQFKKFVPVFSQEIDQFAKDQTLGRSELEGYIKVNNSETINFVDNFIKNNPQVKVDIDEIAKKYASKDLRGKIFKIPKTEEAFQNLFIYIHSNNSKFRQFSVTSEEDSWVIFFL